MGMIQKTLPLADCNIKMAGKGRFAGYASVFNGVDSYGDTILPGAYAETLKNHPTPKMFFNHQSWQLPIGKWLKFEEDKKGLLVEGELTMGSRAAEDVGAAMEHGTVDGLSIGFMLGAEDFEWNENGGRVIKRVSKLVETSIVTWPADSAARIDMDSIKSADIEAIASIRDFEAFLRDVGGFSRALAKALAARVNVLSQRDAGDADANNLGAINDVLSRIAARVKA